MSIVTYFLLKMISSFARKGKYRQIALMAQYKDPVVRREAVSALARASTPAALSLLIPMCQASDERVNDSALACLRALEVSVLEEVFRSSFTNWSADTRKSAIESLRRLSRPDATPLLLPLCRDRDWWVRDAAVSCLSSWDFAQAARVLLEMAGNPQENLAGWAMLSLAKLAESNTQALPGLRNRLEEVAIPALRTAKDSDRRSAAALLAATGFVPGSGDAPDNEDGLLFAIARDDFAPLRQSGQAAVSSATLLHQSGRISDREKRAVLLAFPSADSVEQFCRDRDYEALGAVSKATREFDDKIQSVVERLLGHLKDADYYDEDVSKALISVGNPMAADSIRIALDRGMYEGNNSLQDSAGKFVNAHKRWCGPPETATCEICGRRKAVREMKFYTKEAPPGFGKYLWLWFCKGECWRLRGRVIGS